MTTKFDRAVDRAFDQLLRDKLIEFDEGKETFHPTEKGAAFAFHVLQEYFGAKWFHDAHQSCKNRPLCCSAKVQSGIKVWLEDHESKRGNRSVMAKHILLYSMQHEDHREKSA